MNKVRAIITKTGDFIGLEINGQQVYTDPGTDKLECSLAVYDEEPGERDITGPKRMAVIHVGPADFGVVTRSVSLIEELLGHRFLDMLQFAQESVHSSLGPDAEAILNLLEDNAYMCGTCGNATEFYEAQPRNRWCPVCAKMVTPNV